MSALSGTSRWLPFSAGFVFGAAVVLFVHVCGGGGGVEEGVEGCVGAEDGWVDERV